MFQFGSGVLLAQRNDIANATPAQFGLLQEVSFDFSFDTKELYGQYQFPVAIARGKGKVTGKAKLARISLLAIASLFFGAPLSSGEDMTAYGEAATVPAMTTYTITVANAMHFLDDYGVVYAATGQPLGRVASSPATGQYSVNTATGVYTFNAMDASASVLISYTYTSTVATAQQFTISNQLLGTTPTFQMQLYGKDPNTGTPFNFKAYFATTSKLSLATKIDDFMVPEMDFSLFANPAGNIGMMSVGDLY
jgi:hypothetical protein